MGDNGTGWDYAAEDLAYIQRLPALPATAPDALAAAELRMDPRNVIRVEHQGSQGSCQGHALSSCVEWSASMQTGSPSPQLSRAMAYYETQLLDNIRGDKGSTISGGARLATVTGICLESLWPYPKKYDRRRPADWSAVRESAQTHRISDAFRLRGYADVRRFLGRRTGGISIGLGWPKAMNRDVVEGYKARNRAGGHAVAVLCLSDRLADDAGDPYVCVLNSWGTRSGRSGWHEWSPRCVHQIFESPRTVAVGLSGVEGLKIEPWDAADWRRRLRIADDPHAELDQADSQSEHLGRGAET